AEIALNERDYPTCKDCLAHVIGRDPTNYKGLLILGNLQLSQGQTTQAIANFERVSSLYDRSAPAQFEAARAYLLNGDTAKARAKLNRALVLDPDFSQATLVLANIYLRKGETDAAIASLKDLIKKQPDLAQAYLLLANVYLAQNEPDQAVRICQEMQGRFPSSPEALLVLGSVLAKENRADDARRAFQQCLQMAPTFVPALERIVDLDLEKKDYSAAIDRVTASIQNQQGEPSQLWLLLAKVRIAKAKSFVNATTNAMASPQFGDVPAAQPEISEAEKCLLKSISINPGLRNAYLMLSSLYVSSHRETQAVQRLSDFLSKTNDIAAQMQLGMIQDSLKNFEAARGAYEKVLELDPNFSLALNNLAFIYSEHFGNIEKGYDLAERARRLMPDDPSVADTLGWILFKRGQFERALGIIEESAAKLHDDPEIQYHLGMAHYMLGDEDPARAALQRAVQNPKSFDAKADAERRLAVLAWDVRTAGSAAIADLNAFLKSNPSDPVALCRLGILQERAGATNEAVLNYQAALKCNPQSPAVLIRLAHALLSTDPKHALDLAKQAHTLAPDNAEGSAVLGELVLSSGDPKWALSLLQDAARTLPADPEVAFHLAWAYYESGKVPDALSTMQKASSSTRPDLLSGAQQFMRFASAQEDASKAAGIFAESQKVLERQPNYVPALAVSAMAEEGRGNFKQAVVLYRQILNTYPQFGPAARRLALIYCEHLADDSTAYGYAVSAREAFPKDPDVSKVLGILEYRKGNYRRADQLLREAAREHKTESSVFYYLGMALYKENARNESKDALQKALTLNLPSDLAEDARRVLLQMQ
ncbi:MAG TPA: tetratricopeptide repeat protein, partial [Verrucomicrobiae bacterium]|nr:tetratricopeptide repeat protein [Verrucomicrobiae bacterium]